MDIFGRDRAPLGLGCWPIGGEMYDGAQSLGYTGANDADAKRTIEAALANGITIFDTAAAYGAGHSERLLGEVLGNRDDTMVVTKIGISLNEDTRQIAFDPFAPDDVMPAIDGCLRRLKRERIDLVLLHLNELPVEEAGPLFDAMENARRAGKIGGYGWSTDISASTAAMANRAGFVAVEHAMNVFFDAPRMQHTAHSQDLLTLIRSPLAMGLLGGKYDRSTTLPEADVRAARADWMEYYRDGRPNEDYLNTLDSLVQWHACQRQAGLFPPSILPVEPNTPPGSAERRLKKTALEPFPVEPEPQIWPRKSASAQRSGHLGCAL